MDHPEIVAAILTASLRDPGSSSPYGDEAGAVATYRKVLQELKEGEPERGSGAVVRKMQY